MDQKQYWKNGDLKRNNKTISEIYSFIYWGNKVITTRWLAICTYVDHFQQESVNIPHSFLHNVLVSYSLLLFLGLNIFGGTLHCLNNCYDNLHNFFQALEKLLWEKIRPTFSVTIGLGSNGLKSFSINLNNNCFSPFQFNVLFYWIVFIFLFISYFGQ